MFSKDATVVQDASEYDMCFGYACEAAFRDQLPMGLEPDCDVVRAQLAVVFAVVFGVEGLTSALPMMASYYEYACDC